jgi:hypothetical protein
MFTFGHTMVQNLVMWGVKSQLKTCVPGEVAAKVGLSTSSRIHCVQQL